jgi:hypothetical protein
VVSARGDKEGSPRWASKWVREVGCRNLLSHFFGHLSAVSEQMKKEIG